MKSKLEVELTPDEQEIKPSARATITIVYDNNEYDSRLTPAWGLSCIVRLPQNTILFDTGGDGEILLNNVAKLDIKPEEVDAIVLSHMHSDHIGGLDEFLKRSRQVTVYMPLSFPEELKQNIQICGARVREIHKPEELLKDVFTTGELEGGAKEQPLLVRTSRGLVVITGCAHPGVVNITRRVKQITREKIYLVMGGFHLAGVFPSQINYIAESLLQLGVEKVAPCHCSGDEARKLFKDYFGENYIDSGVGKEIIVE